MDTTTTLPRDLPNMTDEMTSETRDEGVLEYRALYSGALIGALLGVISSAMLFSTDHLSACLALAPIPLIGMIVSLRAWLKIRRERDLYTGGPLALVGLALSLVFLVSGVGQAAYIHVTEVPDGYKRISYLTLKPNQTEERAGKPIPDDVVKLVGQQVFIKGYIRPDSIQSRHSIDRFLLVRDDNKCCFGDLSKVNYFDQIAVKLVGPLRTEYHAKIFRVGGTLTFRPQNLGRGAEYPVYYIEADHIE